MKIPALLGEKDVMKVLQLMPGVQSGSESSTGLYVRGGGADQNLILLDDAPVYNANHLFGFFSVFNGDALKSIELTKGGFPARYGGRLSSVLDITMKEGNKRDFTGEAGVGLISSRLLLEGPLRKDTSSFLISGRRTYIDLLVRPLMPEDEKAGYYFYDLNAKANYTFSRKDKLYVSGYFGQDRFSTAFEDTEAGLNWGNSTVTLRWNHLFNDRLFANASLIHSRYNMEIYQQTEYEDSDYSLSYSSGIKDYGIKYDLQYHPASSHTIRAGFSSTYHLFKPSALVIRDDSFDEHISEISEIPSLESAVYAEDEFYLLENLKVNAGLRLSHFLHEQKGYLHLEPRLSAGYQITESSAIKASYAQMMQSLHLMSNTGIGLPTDLWVPSTENITPQRSRQVAGGWVKDFLKEGITLSVEAYYKKSEKVKGYKEGASFLLIDNPSIEAERYAWEDNITQGQAWSYGTEVLLQKKSGRLSGWIGYTLSWTQLQFDEVNFGEKYYAKYDRRHDVSIVSMFDINENVKVSATWVYGTGNAISLPVGEYNAKPHTPKTGQGNDDPYSFNAYFVNDYGQKNDYRMAPYHRLDLGIQFHKQISLGEQSWNISVYNAYNRQNPFFYYIGYDEQGERSLKQVSLFPIIPSVSYTLKF
ncbi:MAG: TonB-dependent receptor plug domain-containing protein [Bacteroidales bacterium]